MEKVKGYKVFRPDWACLNYKYEVGKTYEIEGELQICENGFHFCKRAVDCFNYYCFDTENKVAEVEALGEVVEDNDKCCTNKIKIVREIEWQEVLDIVNTGKCCTGIGNSGNRNSGDWNSGSWNSGNWNSGSWNSGSWNSGSWNSGNRNSGNRNSGSWNSGNRNSGNHNSGNHNSGDWNKASNVAGCFNTDCCKLRFFDEDTDMTFEQWKNSEACWLMNRIDFRPADWIWSNEMSDAEKAEHPEHETTGGYLKIRDNTDCCKEWWNGLSKNEKQVIKNIPNFDPEIFYEITGIMVEE